MAPEVAAGVLGTPRWAMIEALEHVDEQYGGAEHYLRREGGVPLQAIMDLRSGLTSRFT
jgi:hypothetical protein